MDADELGRRPDAPEFPSAPTVRQTAAPSQSQLQARAMRWLAQREHSRQELQAKLLDHWNRSAPPADPSLVESALDALAGQGLLSEARFIASRVHVRQARWGTTRIRLELKQHGLQLTPQLQSELQASELTRAQAVWARRFDDLPNSPAEHARQARFLMGRGFSGDVVRQVLRRDRSPTSE